MSHSPSPIIESNNNINWCCISIEIDKNVCSSRGPEIDVAFAVADHRKQQQHRRQKGRASLPPQERPRDEGNCGNDRKCPSERNVVFARPCLQGKLHIPQTHQRAPRSSSTAKQPSSPDVQLAAPSDTHRPSRSHGEPSLQDAEAALLEPAVHLSLLRGDLLRERADQTRGRRRALARKANQVLQRLLFRLPAAAASTASGRRRR